MPFLNGVAAKAKMDSEAGSAPADAQAKEEAPAASAQAGHLDQLREFGESLGRKMSAIGEDAVHAATGLVQASLCAARRPPPPAAELQGTFALVIKSGMLGKTHMEVRAFSLIKGKGKETIGADGNERAPNHQSSALRTPSTRRLLESVEAMACGWVYRLDAIDATPGR